MSIGAPKLSLVSSLTQRLLWNRKHGERRSRPLPTVVLLGPTGAGKTHALELISQDCGAGVVHARFDFDPGEKASNLDEPASTVAVLARIAFDLSREWKSRPAVRFTRFALGMIAVQTQLAGRTREQARNLLRARIDNFARNRKAEATVTTDVGNLADAAVDDELINSAIASAIKVLLPRLIRNILRKPLGKAKLWHSDIPEAEGAEPLDALVSLNRQALERPEEMTAWLTAAFLADVRESYLRLAPTDAKSSCTCPDQDNQRKRQPHWHNWVLLLDNIDLGIGKRFIDDLRTARERHLVDSPDDHDPLLIIATSGRWNRTWEPEWCPPWRAAQGKSSEVPRCRAANYEHWLGAATVARSQYYPVLLEPLSVDDIARVLGTSRHTPKCDLVQRATGGLPAAVNLVAPLVRDQLPPPGARAVLTSATLAPPADLGVDLDELVSAAPFATAPWLVPAEATSVVSEQQLGRIITELRTRLWVSAPGGGATSDYAELHPWLARTLVSALAKREPDGRLQTYEARFEALLDDKDTLRDPARKAYCLLALGRLSEVAAEFTAEFDTIPHLVWTNRLNLVTRAPDNLPLEKSSAELFDMLVDEDADNEPNRSPIRNIVTRLIAAKWLDANPFAVADPRLRDMIEKAYQDLHPLSRRSDVGHLHK